MDESKKSGQQAGIFRMRNLLAIIALLFIIALPAFWKFNSVPDEFEDYFAQNFEPYPPANLQYANKPKPNSFDRAMIDYKNGKYTKSSNALKIITASDSATTEHIFYSGMSHLAEDPPKTIVAIESFQNVLTMENNYHDAAQWYLALAYLRHGEENRARDLLWDIARSKQGTYQQQARKLVDKLMMDFSS